jgi:hypothetical protein
MKKKKPYSFLHDGTIGDVWASMPAIMEYWRQTGNKAIVYLRNGQRAKYYKGATHPTRNEQGKMVMLNKQMIKMMIPLLKAQPYIKDAKTYNGEKIDVNLNVIRDTFVNMPNHPLQKWYFYVYPDLTCDLSEQWFFVPDTKKDFAKNKTIVCRTERYNNPQVEYNFIKDYQRDVIFSGTEKEYLLFCRKNKINIPRLKIKNFLELAQALKQSRGLVSNQTMIFQIAEGLKIPRGVELCKDAPNVTTFGKNGFEGYSQQSVEFFFHRINGTIREYYDRAIKKAAESRLSSFKSDKSTTH